MRPRELPRGKSFMLVRGTCSWSVRVKREHVSLARQLNQLTLTFVNGGMPREQYQDQLKALGASQLLPENVVQPELKLAA